MCKAGLWQRQWYVASWLASVRMICCSASGAGSSGSAACRKGVARALLAACEDAARDAGAQLLTLHARLADDAALQVSFPFTVDWGSCSAPQPCIISTQ
jgi:hypothetical protein